MKKTLLICAMSIGLVACAEQRKEEYVMGYELVPTCACSSCVRSFSPCPCMTCARRQQPKPIVVVVPPAPQPVVEHEIVYQPQPSCGCPKCGCQKAAKARK